MESLAERLVFRVARRWIGLAYETYQRARDIALGVEEVLQGGPKIETFRASPSERYALVFAVAKGRPAKSIEIAIRMLAARKVSVLLVVNGSLSSSVKERLSPHLWQLLERKNVGRDFGGYQAGILHLIESGVRPARLVVINDSIFIDEYRARQMFDALLQTEHDFLGVTENHEPIHHVGSFLFSVSGKVFSSEVWKRYWRRYRSYSGRRHTIRDGEIGLSRVMAAKGGFHPCALYSTYEIVSNLRKWTIADVAEHIHLLPTEFRNSIRSAQLLEVFRDGFMIEQSADQQSARRLPIGALTDDIVSKIEARSQVHWAGSLMVKYLGMAVTKKDLAIRGVYGVSDMYQMMQDVGYPDLDEAAFEIGKRGSPVSIRGIKRVLWAGGYI